jgi:hypothetical protein
MPSNVILKKFLFSKIRVFVKYHIENMAFNTRPGIINIMKVLLSLSCISGGFLSNFKTKNKYLSYINICLTNTGEKEKEVKINR